MPHPDRTADGAGPVTSRVPQDICHFAYGIIADSALPAAGVTDRAECRPCGVRKGSLGLALGPGGGTACSVERAGRQERRRRSKGERGGAYAAGGVLKSVSEAIGGPTPDVFIAPMPKR